MKVLLVLFVAIVMSACSTKVRKPDNIKELTPRDDLSNCQNITEFDFTAKNEEVLLKKIYKSIETSKGNAFKYEHKNNYASGAFARGFIFNCKADSEVKDDVTK